MLMRKLAIYLDVEVVYIKCSSHCLPFVYIRKDYQKRCYSEEVKPIEKIKAENEKKQLDCFLKITESFA